MKEYPHFLKKIKPNKTKHPNDHYIIDAFIATLSRVSKEHIFFTYALNPALGRLIRNINLNPRSIHQLDRNV